MNIGWRCLQIDYNARARERLAKSGGARLWAWEVVMMFYEIVIAVDGHAEARGLPVPKTHGARRAIVRRRLPRLAKQYAGLYGPSLKAGGMRAASTSGMRPGPRQCSARSRKRPP